MSEYVLGLDIGTSAVKAVLVDASGELAGISSKKYGADHRGSRFAEQDANDWWTAVKEAIRELTARLPKSAHVSAMSLSTQGGTLVPVKQDGSPLSASRLWYDKRCHHEADYIRENRLADYLYEQTGWSLLEGLNLLQIMWMRENEPELFAATEMFLSVPDFISLKLTGVAAVDASNAGINQLSDIRQLKWDDKLLSLAGIEEKNLAALLESGSVIGPLKKDLADTLGLSEDTLLIAGGHDQYCSALGLGAVAPGDAILGTGTAWVVVAITEEPHYDSKHGVSVSRHVLPDLWGAMFTLETGGSSLAWWRDLAFKGQADTSFAVIDNELEKRPLNEKLFYYPYLSGMKYPMWKSDFHGAFLGMTPEIDQYDMSGAVMEGVAFQSTWQLDTLKLKDSGVVYMSGGGAKSGYWSQIVADILDRPLYIPELTDTGAYGAALIAGLAVGLYDNTEQISARIKAGARLVEPSKLSAMRKEKFELYKENANHLTALKHV
ncbi:MAG: hypothetical protein GX034_06700 [Clostridiaceae bacterium]|nr:hypothetical protein [Clostridiaceae bacterium]